MSETFYVGDSGPVPVTISDENGDAITPLGATATVVNVHTGETVALNEACLIAEGLATWVVPEGHAVTQNPGRYVVYITVEVDASTKKTVAVQLDVLDKASYFAVDRWRRKVEFSAPNDDAITDAEARDWIDQAVDHLTGQVPGWTYTSTMSLVYPTPTRSVMEKIASTAALMARTAWWAGKGNWRDEEMSLDTGPFFREWENLKLTLVDSGGSEWYSGSVSPLEVNSMYNRDKIDQWGYANEPDDYHDATWLGDN